MFSSVVEDHWIPTDIGEIEPDRTVVRVDGSLPENRSVSILRLDDRASVLTLSPARANELGMAHGTRLGTDDVLERLASADVTLNDPDHLFYLDTEARVTLEREAAESTTRRLTADDTDAFARFTAAAPEDDLDEAFVELDHWLVFGAYDGAELAAVASMFSWAGTRLADMGVITLPGHRGRGFGRRIVRAICAAAIEQGFEPQYRCQLDNHLSVALARAAGFTHFGIWEVLR